MKEVVLVVFCLIVCSLAFPFGPGACGGPNGYVSLNGTVSPHSIPLVNNGYWYVTGVPPTYVPGQTYTVTINGTKGLNTADANGCMLNAMAGYILVARDANGIGQGTWAVTPYTQLVHCATTPQTGGGYTASLNEYDNVHVNFTFNGGVGAGHTLFFNGNVTPTTWDLHWTAPAVGAGPLTFIGVAIVDPISSYVLIPAVSNGPAAPVTTATTAAKTPTPVTAAATPLTVGQLAGIVIGSILGFLLIVLVVTPIVFALTHRGDPRVQRWTQRMTGGFDRRNGV
jgi:hypothetical protein